MNNKLDNIDSSKPAEDNYNLLSDSDESQYILPDSDNSDSEESDGNPGKPNRDSGLFVRGWLAFFRIFLSPVEGWKSLRRLHLSVEKCNSILLFPALALCAVVTFIASAAWGDAGITVALRSALASFCSFFFAYFCVIILARPLLARDAREPFDKPDGKNFISVGITSLALFDTLSAAVPVLQPVLVFLPVWTIFVICRGIRLLGVPDTQQVQTSTILSVLVIGLPLAINWLFSFVTLS